MKSDLQDFDLDQRAWGKTERRALSNLLLSYQSGCILQCFLVWTTVFASLDPEARAMLFNYVGDIGAVSSVCFIVQVVRLDVKVHREG
jgi:hypothetical protein